MKMENQFRHECGTTDDDSCGCLCHPGSGAGGCSGCAPMHGSSKMESMDPFEMVIPMWHKGFFAAYSELMIEKLKKRVEAAHGPVMDKVADALMESMGKQWQAMIQKSSAKQELHEKLAKILSEAQKQK